jgi:hypothetical protein
MIIAYEISMRKPGGWRPLVKPVDLKETGCDGADGTQVFQERVQMLTSVNTVMDYRVPYTAGNLLTN